MFFVRVAGQYKRKKGKSEVSPRPSLPRGLQDRQDEGYCCGRRSESQPRQRESPLRNLRADRIYDGAHVGEYLYVSVIDDKISLRVFPPLRQKVL